MQLESTFKSATNLCYKSEFHEGERQLSSLIKAHPSNPMLYINRALFLSQLNEDSQAIKDLQTALELHPFSYIAYFNLFSVQMKVNEEELAFRNILCSLSVMYLVRGRQKLKLEDVEKAIELARNNVEAYVLKGLILMGKGDYEGGKGVFAEAERMNPGNCILDNLVAEADNKIDPSCICLADSGTTRGTFSRRLRSDLPLPDAEGLSEEIARRVTEFNHLYRELSKSVGGITTKVPKELSFMNMSEQLEPQEMEVSRASSNSVIAKLDDEVFTAQSQPDVVSNPVYPAEDEHIGQSSVSNPETEEIAIHIYDQKQQKTLQHQPQKEKEQVPQAQPSYNIYPLAEPCELTISIASFTFLDPKRFSQLQHVYCILNYNSSRKITNTVPNLKSTCTWDKTFQDMFFSSEASPLKVKVYNKQRTEIRDLFIGEFEVLLETDGLLALPIADRQHHLIGDILLRITKGVASKGVPTKGSE